MPPGACSRGRWVEGTGTGGPGQTEAGPSLRLELSTSEAFSGFWGRPRGPGPLSMRSGRGACVSSWPSSPRPASSPLTLVESRGGAGTAVSTGPRCCAVPRGGGRGGWSRCRRSVVHAQGDGPAGTGSGRHAAAGRSPLLSTVLRDFVTVGTPARGPGCQNVGVTRSELGKGQSELKGQTQTGQQWTGAERRRRACWPQFASRPSEAAGSPAPQTQRPRGLGRANGTMSQDRAR